MDVNRTKKWYKRIKVPIGVTVTVCVLPVIITALFYLLRGFPLIMGWAANSISAPIRGVLARVTSVYPFSMMEILIIAAIIGLISYIIQSISTAARRRERWKILGKRLLPIVIIAMYMWSIFCWLWNVGYHAPGFAERNGFTGRGVNAHNLAEVSSAFAQRANELSLLVERDEAGRYLGNRGQIFADSLYVFENISREFPCLEGRLFRPKPMLFSWLMSRTGYGGIYFALTGEANINVLPPYSTMPVTVAHEHAHHLGVFAEDEANFVAILASITSDNLVFQYAGYLRGLIYLMDALRTADYHAWQEISNTLYDEVRRDWNELFEFWQSQRTVDVGIDIVDTVLTAVTETMRESVDFVYDAFLRAHDQELGLLSYGACVDLIIEYFVTRGMLPRQQ
ncbi:MAG: DUF3810 domain-containing protein [Oscillospiraceae bacterium]|nr:DUF3810 domain-containing protein [Oscillospiraceae bacterium]